MKPHAIFWKIRSEFEGFFGIQDETGKWLVVRAASGQKGFQADFWRRGLSPIPSSASIQGKYMINLNGYPPGSPGAMGSIFYPIKPDPIESKTYPGLIRTEIGLHYDENWPKKPGSAGCAVVLPRKHGEPGWTAIKVKIKEIRESGVSLLPLEVIYPTDVNAKPPWVESAEPDEEEKHWADKAFEFLTQEGIITGSKEEFPFNTTMTTGRMYVIVERMMKKLREEMKNEQ